MLERLTLFSFQTHRKLVITFDPYVTTIVGTNDVGKSTVVRALRWLFLNQIEPNAEAAIHWDYEGTRVKLEIDGHTIARSRIKSENLYTLDGKKFKAFGSSVPDQISKLLNVGNENFQQQLDTHFWFANTPGQVSKALNRIVNLEVIDRTQGNIASELRRARAVVEVSEQRLALARAAKKELRWVPYLNDKLCHLEELKRIAVIQRSQIAALKEAVIESKRLEHSRQNAAHAAKIGARLLASAERVETIKDRVRGLAQLIHEAKVFKQRRDEANTELQAAKQELSKWRRCPTCGSQIRS